VAAVLSQVPVLDRQALENMLALTEDQEIFCDILCTYLDETPKLLATLQTAVAQGDAVAMERVAHSLKSSSATLGALALSALCARLEALGRAQTTDSAPAVLAQITTQYEAVRDALTSELQHYAECTPAIASKRFPAAIT
jgi:HPt (histidine-containing phosphotransfer) domain-containing protein